jgi:signal-transduction protein with cAMP-binding, CBS, and nucleotidyltransferase domain
LEELGALPRSESRELQQAYALMMDLRLSEQARVVLEEGRDPLNSIFPKELGHIQKQSLKASFKSLQKVQERLQAEFLGGYVG